jgi:hypothetical protein
VHNTQSSGDIELIFHLVEKWMNQNNLLKCMWQVSNESGGLKVPLRK